MKKIQLTLVLLSLFIISCVLCKNHISYANDVNTASSTEIINHNSSTYTVKVATNVTLPGESQDNNGTKQTSTSSPGDGPATAGRNDYIVCTLDSSVQDIADQIRVYIDKYNATTINGYNVNEDNINDVAQKILDDYKKNANTSDSRNIMMFMFVSSVFGVYLLRRHKIKF